jgi:hypothetical protein
MDVKQFEAMVDDVTTVVETKCDHRSVSNICSVEVDRLRKQVDDLQGALKARDIELASLREQYELLVVAVEQQDEAIASIYATVGIASTSQTQAMEQYSAIRESCNITLENKKEQQKSNVHAQELLKAHLDTMGFDEESVNSVLDTLNAPSSSMHRGRSLELQMLNTALDQLFHEPQSLRNNDSYVNGSDQEEPSQRPRGDDDDDDDAIDDRDSREKRQRRRRHSLCLGDHVSLLEVAKSAAFLQPPERRKTKGRRRLSVSDFGLLDCRGSTRNHETTTTRMTTVKDPLLVHHRRMSDPLFPEMDTTDETQEEMEQKVLSRCTHSMYMWRTRYNHVGYIYIMSRIVCIHIYVYIELAIACFFA